MKNKLENKQIGLIKKCRNLGFLISSDVLKICTNKDMNLLYYIKSKNINSSIITKELIENTLKEEFNLDIIKLSIKLSHKSKEYLKMMDKWGSDDLGKDSEKSMEILELDDKIEVIK